MAVNRPSPSVTDNLCLPTPRPLTSLPACGTNKQGANLCLEYGGGRQAGDRACGIIDGALGIGFLELELMMG